MKKRIYHSLMGGELWEDIDVGSNLPPGCSSPDGGIDHVYEATVEDLCAIVDNTEDMQLIVDLAPALLQAFQDSFKSGFNNGKMEAEQMADNARAEHTDKD